MQNYSSSNIFILFAIACGMFMENIDATIITTSVPIMAQSLKVDPVSLKLALTSYLLSLAIFVPISGWIAERFGCKIIFTLSFIIFIIGSFLCGISTSLTQLIIFRIIQGVGGALMVPVGTLLTLKIFGTENYLRVVNFIIVPALIGPVIGPILGGFLSYHYNWHWIFFINIPVGILAIILATKFIPNDLPEVQVAPIDLWGFLFFTLGLTGVNTFLNLIDENFLTFKQMLFILLISIIAIILYLIKYKTTANPIWNLSIFKIRTFKIMNIGSLITRLGIGGIPFLLPLFFESALHFNSYQAGLLLFPLALGMIFAKFMFRTILKLFGYKTVLIYNTLLLGLNIISFSFVGSQSNIKFIVFLVVLFGIFSSLHYSALWTLIFFDIEEKILNQATSISSSIQLISNNLGIVMVSITLHFFLKLSEQISYSYNVFKNGFIFIGLLTLASAHIFSYLKKDDGSRISGNIIKRKNY